MGFLRTDETESAYSKIKEQRRESGECGLCLDASLHEFKLWRIIENKFPYDHIARMHHMVVLKRHAPDANLTMEEQEELQKIKNTYVQDIYDFMIESTQKQKSVPAHAHLHLIVEKA